MQSDWVFMLYGLFEPSSCYIKSFALILVCWMIIHTSATAYIVLLSDYICQCHCIYCSAERLYTSVPLHILFCWTFICTSAVAYIALLNVYIHQCRCIYCSVERFCTPMPLHILFHLSVKYVALCPKLPKNDSQCHSCSSVKVYSNSQWRLYFSFDIWQLSERRNGDISSYVTESRNLNA